ncbi:MAG TPA: tetratricopeptide repeat protein, partial [Phycisphaeraceae bacterium]
LLRAQAALLRGEPERVLQWLAGQDSAQAVWLMAQAHEQLGEMDQAVALLRPWRDRLEVGRLPPTAADRTAAAQALALLARLEGRPAQDYELAMEILGQVRQELDPLYWPAYVAEAELLLEKDNRAEAVDALLEALSLSPRCGPAWRHLGQLAATGFDFQRAGAAIEQLRRINPHHLLADLLEAHTCLMQRDSIAAGQVVTRALARYPHQRELLALRAAAEALGDDEAAWRAAIEAFDAVSPGSAMAHQLAGIYLSLWRQYEAAETVLREAVRRQPNWPAPRIELGLMLMQAGRLDDARVELARAAELDPFNRRANNQLKLAEALRSYEVIETEHFIIRYHDGVDAALAQDMPEALEGIYRQVTGAFEHQPARKTQIELMPDEDWFGVRITGLPEIWTIAASTGDVIAMTPPRDGPRQRGIYDWVNVIRHEFVHTVTLSQARNRLPHWLAEACAVWQERVPRDYETCRLLTWALQQDKLFELDQINWGFIRPRAEYERPLAYAQAYWMLEYIVHRWGRQAVLDLIEAYGRGGQEIATLERILDCDQQAFMSQFKQWARSQAQQWGLLHPPLDPRLQAILEGSSGQDLDATQLTELAAQHGDHPELLRLAAQRAMAQDDPAAAQQAVMRYAAACPVDPWPMRAMANLAIRTGRVEEAIAHLEQLDRQETHHGDWAHQLAKLYRQAGRLDDAGDAMRRALEREPYNASYRELAATIALQRGLEPEALRHLQALAAIEPGRAIHQVRLAALYQRMGQPSEAQAAAQRARQIDPNAPVERFLTPATSPSAP